MNEITIICILPEEVKKYHRDLRQKIATQFGLDGIANPVLPAHITIKYRFPIEDIDEVEKAVQEFSMSQTKTKWLLKGFNHFVNDEHRAIFIDVISSDETRKAHANFLDRLRKINWIKWGQFDNANLHYHVTLAAKGITSEIFDSVWAFVEQQEEPEFDTFFDNLTLVQISEDAKSIYKTYQFQNLKAG